MILIAFLALALRPWFEILLYKIPANLSLLMCRENNHVCGH